MIKPLAILQVIACIGLCACHDTPKEAVRHEDELMRSLFIRAGYKPSIEGEGYFFYKTYGIEHTESYKELALSTSGRKAVMYEIYSPKRGGEVSKNSYEVSQAEVEALKEIIETGRFWASDVKFEQTSLGGGIAVLGGWKAGTVKLHSDIPPEAPLAKAEAWFEKSNPTEKRPE